MLSRYLAFAGLALALLPATAQAAAAKKAAPAASATDPSVQAILKSAPTAATYPNSASATLLDQSIIDLKADGTYVEKTHETVKVFNERGRDEADITIPFNSSGQKIENLVARTILPNGKVLTVRPADIYAKSPFSEFGMYDDAKMETFSMPGIEDGAIIDYSYTLVNFKPMLPGQYSDDWSFSDGDKPAMLSRLQITAPATLKLNTEFHNASGLKPIVKTSADGRSKTYTWQMSNLPDIDPEPMMPPLKDVIPWMQVSTVPSWQTLSHWYWTLEKPQAQITPALHSLVLKLTAGKPTEEAKAKALFYWVEQNVRYVAVEFGESAFKPHSAAMVYQNRYGDCKDMATLLTTMLRDAGISNCQDVLLGAGNTDPVSGDIASTGAFNHCIARATIDGKPYWFDCTAEICGFGNIPGADRGVNVLVVYDGGKGEFQTVPKATPDSDINMTHETVTLHADGSAVCKNEMIASGDSEMAMREAFRELKPDMVGDAMRSIVSHESPNATLDGYQISDLQDRDTPFHISYSYDAPVWGQNTGNLLIITPAQVNGLTTSFSKPTRKYPIYSSGSSSYQSTMTLTIPDGYSIEDKPQDATVSLPFGNFQRTVTVTGNTVEIDMTFDSTPCLVPASQYQQVKAQAEKLREVAVQPLVLKKASAPAGTSSSPTTS